MPLNQDYRIKNSIQLVEDTYGDVISVDAKKKNLIKFGRNDNVSTSYEMVRLTWGIEETPTTNSIDTIVSTSGSDTETISIEWHTISWSDLTFVVQTATLNGTTDVSLSTPLYRVTRVYNTDSTDFVWDITITDSTSGDTHATIESTDNQSLKCATSTSSIDYWLITDFVCSVNRTSSRSVDFKLQIRESGKVWRTRYPVSTTSTQWTYQVTFDQPIIVRPNSDMRVIAISSGSSTPVQAAVHWYLAKIQ